MRTGRFPPKVYYLLTPQVVGSLAAQAPLVGWAWAHREIIELAKAHRPVHAR